MRVQSLGQKDPLEEEMVIPRQYSGLGSPMDRGAWRAKVHRFTESQTQLSTHTFLSFPSGRSES